MQCRLLIVESPSKAKQIEKKFDGHLRVVATGGHFCDLPKDEMGFEFVDFKPKYLIDPQKRKSIKHIIELAKTHDVFLGPDLDREGEAIAAHLARELKLNNPKRVTYQEVTKSEIEKSLNNPTKINFNLVKAQEARRVIDRMIGYVISPMLGNIQKNSSAGRVQTAGLLVIIDRHFDIVNFKPQPYIIIECTHNMKGVAFKSKYKHLSDNLFNDITLTSQITKDINTNPNFTLYDIDTSEVQTKAPCPFTTSLMQQAASNKFGWTAEQTMKHAQKLFEDGHITYHRTDSKHLAEDFCVNARNYLKIIEKKFNIENLIPEKFNKFSAKAGAQEAHEAIRPTTLNFNPKELGDSDLIALYSMIMTRAIASQASNAISLKTTYLLKHANEHIFESKGTQILFKGWKFIAADDANDDSDEEADGSLPPLTPEDNIPIIDTNTLQKKTTPKSYFTEATFIKALESKGVGRPSTFASIIKTIETRAFITRDKKKLIPTAKGIECGQWLRNNFSAMDIMYTAKLEKVLDEITRGNIEYPVVAKKVFDRLLTEIQVLASKNGFSLGENGLPSFGERGSSSEKEQCPTCKKQSVAVYRTKKDINVLLMACNTKGCKQVNRLKDTKTNTIKELNK